MWKSITVLMLLFKSFSAYALGKQIDFPIIPTERWREYSITLEADLQISRSGLLGATKYRIGRGKKITNYIFSIQGKSYLPFEVED